MPSTLLEAFELLVDAERLAPRLEAADSALAQLPELADEKAWLAAARARLAGISELTRGNLLDRALRLPELESVKGERGKLLQGAIADEVERLQAGITLASGARSPLLEIVFSNLKVPALRKAARPELERFCAELERRLATSYAVRILATERHQDVARTVQRLGAAVATWRSVFVDLPSDGAAAGQLRDELAEAGRGVELAVRQARLLAQAALLPAAELLDAAGVVVAKPKRRGTEVDADTHPLLEQDPPSPLLPTAAEREEIAALSPAT